jgi:ABC-type antimicrobial peptide transport system permease subunit
VLHLLVESKNHKIMFSNFSIKKHTIGLTLSLCSTLAFSQNRGIQAGAQALTQATNDVKGYFEPVTTLIYVVAAIVGLVGGFRVYNKWQNGDQEVQKHAVGWFGAVLFLLAIAAILQAVFF